MPDGQEQLPIGQVAGTDALRSTYANFVTVNFTPWDFRLTFAVLKSPMPGAEVAQAKEAGAIQPEAVVDVILPANLINGLIRALQQSVDQYEKQYGARAPKPEGRGNGEEQRA